MRIGISTALDVEDGATVPLYYENRVPELQLINDDFDDDMRRLIEAADLDEDQERQLERQFARDYQLITRDERLEKIASDLVAHFMERGQRGKAMVVSIDKATAVRMYDKVRCHWQAYLASLRARLAAQVDMPEEARAALRSRIAYMESTDMAVVVSQAQNEIEDFKARRLEIEPHRRRMVKEDLETKFKDPGDLLRIVFVCAMWMTGFDAPAVSTIYLDKPMRNHTLVQTIARANLVFGDKVNGLIVDYVGIFRDLQRALALYGAAPGVSAEDLPIKDKAALVAQLAAALTEAEAF
jgi:type I restriction enzyme, R subunit